MAPGAVGNRSSHEPQLWGDERGVAVAQHAARRAAPADYRAGGGGAAGAGAKAAFQAAPLKSMSSRNG